MARLVRGLLRTVSVLLNQLYSSCLLIPVEVADDERIVRAVFSPMNIKNNQIKRNFYEPPIPTDELSVMRLEYLGAKASKTRAKKIQNPPKGRTYHGFAAFSVGKIRVDDISVADSRNQFCGPALDGKRLKELQDHLIACSKFYPDLNPARTNWTGGPLSPP
jgi:hypothetical protein